MMNRHLLNQELGILPLFDRTNNAGMVVGRIEFEKPWWWEQEEAYRRKRLNEVLLLEYKPHARDKQAPHDIQLRVSRNMGKKEPVEVRAAKWMNQYPQVYAAFVQAAFAEAEFTNRGSAKFIAECLRRRRDLVAGKPFKIPNAHVTYMALRFMEEHPAYAGLFKTTKRK